MELGKRTTYPQNTLRPNQLDQRVGDGGFGVALRVGRKVSEITDMTFIVGGSAMGFPRRIDYKRYQRSLAASEYNFSRWSRIDQDHRWKDDIRTAMMSDLQ